jgi:hypothetical protein
MQPLDRRLPADAGSASDYGVAEAGPAVSVTGGCPPSDYQGDLDLSPGGGQATGELGQHGSSAGCRTPHESEEGFLERTLQLWRPRSSQYLTRDDARQVVGNVAGFFRVLAEWAALEDGHSDSEPPRKATPPSEDRA